MWFQVRQQSLHVRYLDLSSRISTVLYLTFLTAGQQGQTALEREEDTDTLSPLGGDVRA